MPGALPDKAPLIASERREIVRRHWNDLGRIEAGPLCERGDILEVAHAPGGIL